MSATEHTRPRPGRTGMSMITAGIAGTSIVAAGLALIGIAGIALAAATEPSDNARVAALLKARLPKTAVTRVDCGKVVGLCEVTAGDNLFYVDAGGRFLMIGRIYDLETREDLTAARLLELNPDLLVGGAARANAAGAGEGASAEATLAKGRQPTAPVKPRHLSLAGLPDAGAIVWGKPAGTTVTVFTDLRCGYCRALTSVLADMNVRVVERPISVLGSRDLADRVYCARDRARALHAAYADAPFETGGKCDTSGLDANERFARQHGLTGTPVIVRGDGAMLEGFRPKAFLEAWIREGRS